MTLDHNRRSQLAKLWKERHKHDGENFQQQIQIIRQTVETQADEVAVAASSGAYIHLVAASQTIAAGGEPVEWTSEHLTLGRFVFDPVIFPSTSATIPRLGYYNVHLKDFAWDTFTGGGTVQVVRTRGGVGTVVWEWVESDGQEGGGTAHAFHCEPGDEVSVFIDHGEGSGQTLASAELHLYLVEREGTSDDSPWELLFDVDNYGVTHDGTRFWTTDDTDDVDPALFERDVNGTAVNSYSGYDVGPGGQPDRNRSIVYADGFLWGVGNAEAVSKVNPANGSVVSTFPWNGTGESIHGIGYNGTNLFVSEREQREIREFTLAGAHQTTTTHPDGLTIRDLTWDGLGWWATLQDSDGIIHMDVAFAVDRTMAGPTSTNQGCHYRDGWLYVMTPSGLFRTSV